MKVKEKLEIPPFDTSLGFPFGIDLELDGEKIIFCKLKLGFARKGLESAMMRQEWAGAMMVAGHVDPSAPVFSERAYCEAVEALGSIKVPMRARVIRDVLCSLSSVSSYLLYMMVVARSVGANTIFQYLTRDREKVLDQLELLTGSRFGKGYLRFGGVLDDVTEGFIERVQDVCEYLRFRLKEYNDLFTYNSVFERRATNVGIASGSVLAELGIGSAHDGPDAISLFEGDCHQRFVSHLKALYVHVRRVKQSLEDISRGEFRSVSSGQPLVLKPGKISVSTVGPRGKLTCDLESRDGRAGPGNVLFKTPSENLISLFERTVCGERFSDFELIFSSFGIQVLEVDR